MRIRVKICGITRLQDALDACHAGADALGFVFFSGSKRCVSVEVARSIVNCLPPFVTTVALFVDPEAGHVESVLSEVGIDLLQFHGDEAPEFCSGFGRPYLKAIAMTRGVDVAAEARRFEAARALLLDARSDAGFGGTGQTFEWGLWPGRVDKPLVLAGGLDPGNVAAAVALTRPYAVDVSSGVECGPGIKDPEKVAKFINEVRRAGDAG